MTLGDRLEVNHRHAASELHNFRLHQALLLKVPFGTFKEETCNESTILDHFGNVSDSLLGRDKVELQSVD